MVGTAPCGGHATNPDGAEQVTFGGNVLLLRPKLERKKHDINNKTSEKQWETYHRRVDILRRNVSSSATLYSTHDRTTRRPSSDTARSDDAPLYSTRNQRRNQRECALALFATSNSIRRDFVLCCVVVKLEFFFKIFILWNFFFLFFWNIWNIQTCINISICCHLFYFTLLKRQKCLMIFLKKSKRKIKKNSSKTIIMSNNILALFVAQTQFGQDEWGSLE